MKQFFGTGTMLIVTMLFVSLAIIFRTQLLSSYDRTRVSFPTEFRPTQSQPVPASIRTDDGSHSVDKSSEQPGLKQPGWGANSISDFTDAPEEVKNRIKTNVRLPNVDKE